MGPVRIVARNMIEAQGVRLDAESAAYIQSRADRFRLITGETGPQRVMVPVYSPSGARIGEMTYTR